MLLLSDCFNFFLSCDLEAATRTCATSQIIFCFVSTFATEGTTGYDTLQTFLLALTWQVGVQDAVEAGWQLVATMLSGQTVRICPPLELDTKSDERCGVPDTGGGGHNDTETCHVANEREIGFQNALESQRWNALFGISEMAIVV